MTTIEILMPQMGESLTEGTIVKWLKAPGETIAVDEALCEISTDKVDTELPSPKAGVLRRVLVKEGEVAQIGAPLAVIDIAADASVSEAAPVVGAGVGRPDERTVEGAGSSRPGAEVPTTADGHFRHAEHTPVLEVKRAASGASGGEAGGPARSFSPAVLGAAREGGVALSALTTMRGTGRGGRVTKRDVERFLAERPAPASASAAVPPSAATAQGWTVPDEYQYRPRPEDTVVPLSPVRRQIARAMTWTMRISPHATSSTECDMSEVVGRVEREREAVQARAGAPLTYTALVAFAVVRTLKEFPSLNASVVEEALALKPYVNLGIAVALEENEELIVPVVHNAHELSLEGLVRAIDDLSTRARARRLQHADVSGGTFTLTNTGMFGGTAGTPLVVQPQVGILGMTAIRKQVVAVGDAIAIRPMMTLCLGHDHRAVDGMAAFRFIEAVRRRLERPNAGVDA